MPGEEEVTLKKVVSERRPGGPGIRGHGKDGNRQVDPVEEGAGKFPRESIEERGRATAHLPGVSRVSAWAGVRRRQQQEPAREPVPVTGPGDPDLPGFDGLPERFPDLGAEFGELVEEEHAGVGEGDLSRAGRVSPAQEPGRGDRGVGRPERPPQERPGPGRLSRDAVDARRLEGLGRREVGQDPRDHLNLIFQVYLKLMTGFPSIHPDDVGAELLH
jgi:hypothetical protein